MTQQSSQPKNSGVVHVSRPMDPPRQQISAELQRRHDESKQKYPSLNLSPGEYVIDAVNRHPIGLVEIWGIVVIAALTLLILLPIYGLNQSAADSFSVALPSAASLLVPVLAIIALFVLGAVIATKVYNGNTFFLTNESVIQEIQTSLFSKKEQTISLGNIEDASYRQQGIFQTLLNYGSIRLSTEGDETTYRFTYVANPKRHIARLNNAVEAFKNGRPVAD